MKERGSFALSPVCNGDGVREEGDDDDDDDGCVSAAEVSGNEDAAGCSTGDAGLTVELFSTTDSCGAPPLPSSSSSTIARLFPLLLPLLSSPVEGDSSLFAFSEGCTLYSR